MPDPLSREAFRAAFDEIAPRVAQGAPPGLSREAFNDLVIQEIERSRGAGVESPDVSLVDRLQLMAMRMGPTAAGGLIGSAAGPIGTAIGSGIGALVGEYGAEVHEQQLGMRDEINPVQLGVQTALGAIPLGRVAGSTIGQIAGRRALQGAGMGGVSAGLTESAETGELPSVSTIGQGLALGGLVGGAAGHVEGRGLRRLGRLDVPEPPAPAVAGYLPAGPRYVSTPDGQVVPVGTDIPPQADRSFVRGVPAEYARREIAGALPPGRQAFVTEPPAGSVPTEPQSSVRSVPAASYFDEHGQPVFLGDVDAVSTGRPVRGLLGPGARFTAPESGPAIPAGEVDAPRAAVPSTDVESPQVPARRAAVMSRELDPMTDPAQALKVRQYSSDPDAIDVPIVGDAERAMLQRMRADLDAFPSEPGRLIRDPHDPGFDRYSHGGPGTEVGDDIRTISGTRASNAAIARAIDDLLAGKPLTNKLHVAALDAAQGVIEKRPGYRGPRLPADVGAPSVAGRGGEPVDDFERFVASLDEVPAAPPSVMREPGQEGFIANQLLLRAGGGLGGAAIGAASGDTPQERIENALLYGTAGVAAPWLLPRRTSGTAARQPIRVDAELRPIGAARTAGASAARAGNLNPPASQRAMGQPRVDPLAGTERFLDRVSAGNPLLRDGIAERLRAANGYDTQRRGVLGIEATGDLANRVRVDVGRSLPRGTAPNAETVVAYTRAANQTMGRVRELGARVSSGQATDADVIAFAAAQADADVVLKSLMGLRSEAGRALAAFRAFSAVLETGDVNLIRQAANPLREDAARLAGEVAQRGTPLEQYQYLQSLGKASFADKVRSYYYANILSGVKTHERNALGNAASILSRFASTPFAAGIDAVRSARTGAPRQVRLGELQPAVVGAVAGVERGIGDFLFTLKHGVSPDALSRSVSAAADLGRLDLPRVEFGGGGRNPFNWPGRLLDATDAFFRNVARQQELYSSAWTRAVNEGVSGQRLVTRAADLRVDETLRTSADRFAAESVFQHKPGPITGLLQAIQRHVPGASFVVPFIKTPANILRSGIQASPAGFATAAAREGGRVGAQAQGLAAMGTVLLAPLAWLAATGRLSGAGPSDPAERAALMESGWRPNTIRIGDKWVEYALFQPVSVQASVIANAFEGWQRDGADEQDLGAVVGEVLARVGNTVLEQSFLSGLNDVFEALKSPERSGANVVGRLAHSLTPFAGAQRTVTQALDPTVRQPKTAREVFLSNVPGQSQQVPPRLTRFGEPVQRPSGGATAVDPFNTSPVIRDAVADELTRLGVSVSLPSDRLTLPGGATLSPEQSLAHRQEKGRALYRALDQLIANPNYQRLPDALKRNAVERVKDASNRTANDLTRRDVAQRTRDANRRSLMDQLGGGR
jgi:hypothetical protein